MELYLGKVTREYTEQEQERMKREARQQSKMQSGFILLQKRVMQTMIS